MKIIESKIIPIPRKDIDTDLIIPGEFLVGTTKNGLGDNLFAEVSRIESDFPINLEKYKDGKIILARENFGCGSSREHAAWALADWGIEAVIAPSFADIFYNNALKNKILPVVLDEKIVEKIFKEEADSGSFILKIDLPEQKVYTSNNEEYNFEINPYSKECLIKEIDDLDYLLDSMNEIEEFEKEHKKKIFFDISKL